MTDEKYKIPETYEEAVKRKQELLEKINAYNEALFAEKELPYTDEEIEAFQEEFQILNDNLDLTDEEKLEKLDDEDKIVNEDGSVEVKKSFFDKLHITTYLYLFLGTLVVLLFSTVLLPGIANGFISKFNTTYFEKVYADTEDYLIMISNEDYIMPAGKFYFFVVLFTIVLPFSILLLSGLCFIISRKMDDINKKVFLFVFLVHVAITLIGVALIFFIKILPEWKSYYEDYSMRYAVYVYSKYLYSGYGN